MNYGASYNCFVGYDYAIGDAKSGERLSTLDFVSNDLDKLEAHVINECVNDEGWDDDEFYADHDQLELLGQRTDVGGKVVSVIYYMESDNISYPVAVIFEDPLVPEVI